MDIIHWFQPWGQERSIGTISRCWTGEALDRAVARGGADDHLGGLGPDQRRRPLARGQHHRRPLTPHRLWAQGLAEFGRPVYLRLFHEMNIAYAPWAYGTNGNTAEDLIVAWRYVHDRFRRAGATNVRWVWCPNTEDDRIGYRALYPGDAYVDWFGVDGYNGGTELPYKGAGPGPSPSSGAPSPASRPSTPGLRS